MNEIGKSFPRSFRNGELAAGIAEAQKNLRAQNLEHDLLELALVEGETVHLTTHFERRYGEAGLCKVHDYIDDMKRVISGKRIFTPMDYIISKDVNGQYLFIRE